jgi:tetratricopeptide (TPR) repeat protein
LLVAVHGAAGRGDDTHAWLLAAAMAEHAQRRGYWQDWEAVHRVGLMAAARSGDRLGEVVMHRGLGRVLLTRGDTVSAREHLAESAAGAGRLDLPLTMAITLLDQARLWLLEDDTTAALNHAAEAVEQFGLADHPIGAARALNLLSRIRARRGEYPDAISACSRALTVHDESGYPDLDGTAATLDTLGYVLQRSGDPAGAATTYARAVNLYRQVGADRLDEAATLRRLGDCQAALGDVDAARSAWQDELTILIELNHPDAQTRRRLWE